MPKDIRWKIPLIIIVIAIAIFALYPPFEKPIKKERIREVGGKVVKRETIEKNWVSSLVSNPIVTETVLNRSTDESGAEVVEKIAEYKARGQIKLGLDLKGGSELLYEVRVNKKEDRAGLTKEIIEVLKKRIDPKGILEYRIQEQGSHRILIQIPGATRGEIEAFKQRLTRLGKLEFRLAAARESSEYQAAQNGQKVPGYYKHWIRKTKGEQGGEGEENNWFLVSNKTEITGEHLSRVFPDRKDVQAVVGFEFDQIGKAKFGKLTERNIGKPLAIILDGILYSAPLIRDRIPGRGIIEGGFTQVEVNDLIAVMRAGSLPADLQLEMETTVGPSLGKDSIAKGLRAGLIASIFVLLFMGIFYLGVGWVANFALALNILLILGALVIITATVTLPGLAGLVLTIGIAVDANVLIFERIREEKNTGKTIKLAVKTGYERAFRTIFDANITTLITAVILAAVGTGPVKGFAWVLIIGLLVNLFTSVLVTRTIFNIFLGKQWIGGFHMLKCFSKTSFSFVSFRGIAVPVSIFLIVGGLTIFTIRGSDNYDIDFTGGTLVHLQLKEPTSVNSVRKSLKDKGYPDAEVQGLWAEDALATNNEPTDFGVRIKGLAKNKLEEKVSKDAKLSFANQGVQCNISFINPMEFNLSTGQPVEESLAQRALADAGYRDDDIISVEAPNANSKNFDIVIPTVGNIDERAKILSDLNSKLAQNLVSQEVNISFGDISEAAITNTLNQNQGQSLSSVSTMELDANKKVDPVLVYMEINKAGFTGTSVYKRDQSRGALTGKMEVRGSKSVLEEIKGKINRKLQLPAMAFVNDKTIRIELKESAGEGQLRAELLKVAELDDSLQKLITLNSKSDRFLVKMNPLRTGKIQEKIQDDIVEIFSDRLYTETVKVEFSQKEAPQSENNLLLVSQKEEKINLLNLALSVPLKKDKIERVLTGAGFADMLNGDLIDGKAYSSVELNTGDADIEPIKAKIASAFVIPMPLKRVVSIGAAVAGEMKGRAILALIFACFAIIIYVWYRFGEFKYGAAAVIALIHDVTITLGAVAVADYFGNVFGDIKLNLPMVAAFLTLVGYSLNDTIVLFDRIRENVGGKKGALDGKLVDLSVNQNLNRTVLTSLTTLGVLFALYFIGGPEIHGFAFVMLVGVFVGTYSSIFIASPILVRWKKSEGKN